MFLDDLFLNTWPCTVDETVLPVGIVVIFSFLNISMGFTPVVMELSSNASSVHYCNS